MEKLFPLTIFPTNFIDHSLLVPVLIGLIIIIIFNELFGWDLSGYVVPGYLAPIFITFPSSGLVMVFESIFTYLLVYLFSENLSKIKLWSRFFGRERFFLFVFCSIIVRLVLEAWIWPRVSLNLSEITGLYLRDEFYSIGLVLVPLMANSYWKTGLSRGIIQKGVQTGLTYFLLVFVLIPYTNLNLGKFQLTYENLFLNFLAAPKIYIIILITAFLASNFNKLYGWDFNGILIPPLVAICFFMPVKLASTIGEIIISVYLYKGAMKLPLIRTLNWHGGRKVLFIFTTTLFLKWFMAVTIPELPRLQLNDLFGFGYLLPALIAIKIVERGSFFKVFSPIIVTATIGMILGSSVGFLLYSSEKIATYLFNKYDIIKKQEIIIADSYLFKDLLLSKAYVLTAGFSENYSLQPRFVDYYDRVIRNAFQEQDKEALCDKIFQPSGIADLQPMDCKILKDPELGEYAMINESINSVIDRKGTGIFFIRYKAKGPVVIVPYPIRERDSLEAAYVITKILDARMIMVAGIDEKNSPMEWADSQKYNYSLLQRIYEKLPAQDVIILRIDEKTENKIFVRYNIPDSLNIKRLRQELGELKLLWNQPEEKIIQWNTSDNNLAIIYLNKNKTLLVSPRYKFTSNLKHLENTESVTGLIEKWILEQKHFIQKANSGKYLVPAWHELQYFNNEILADLWEFEHLAEETEIIEKLNDLQLATFFIDYQVLYFRDSTNKKNYVILKEIESETSTKGWGTYIFKIGEALPWLFIVPRPLENIGTLGLSAKWFEDQNVRSLFVPGASFKADPWGKSDILSNNGTRNLAQTILRNFLSHYSDNINWLTVMIQGNLSWRMKYPVMLSFGEENVSEANISTAGKNLIDYFRKEKIDVGLFKGTFEDYGMQGFTNPIENMSKYLSPDHFAILWISEEIRRTIMEGSRLERMIQLFETYEVPYKMGYAKTIFEQFVKNKEADKTGITASDLEFNTLLADFAKFYNINSLKYLKTLKDIKISGLISLRETRVFVFAETKDLLCVALFGQGKFEFDETENKSGAVKKNASEKNCILK